MEVDVDADVLVCYSRLLDDLGFIPFKEFLLDSLAVDVVVLNSLFNKFPLFNLTLHFGLAWLA